MLTTEQILVTLPSPDPASTPTNPFPLDIAIVLSPYAHAPWTLLVFMDEIWFLSDDIKCLGDVATAQRYYCATASTGTSAGENTPDI